MTDTETISVDRWVDRRSFARMWPDRNDEHVHVFPGGHVYDRTERRASVRSNIRAQRSARANEATGRPRMVTVIRGTSLRMDD